MAYDERLAQRIRSAWLYVMELFGWRKFANRRELGSLAGLTVEARRRRRNRCKVYAPVVPPGFLDGSER